MFEDTEVEELFAIYGMGIGEPGSIINVRAESVDGDRITVYIDDYTSARDGEWVTVTDSDFCKSY